MPLLPGNEASNDDDVEIIISSQIESTTKTALAIGKGDDSPQNSDEDEDQLQREDWGGFGYDRVRNSYSDDEKVEAVIVVAGVQIAVPQSRVRD